MKTTTPKLIAIVDTFKLCPPMHAGLHDGSKEIKIGLGRLDPDDGKPRNYSRQGSEEREDSAGGQRALLRAHRFGTDPVSVSFYYNGPDIHYGVLMDYKRALKGLERVERLMAAMGEKRGYTVDAADALGRWFEARTWRERGSALFPEYLNETRGHAPDHPALHAAGVRILARGGVGTENL